MGSTNVAPSSVGLTSTCLDLPVHGHGQARSLGILQIVYELLPRDPSGRNDPFLMQAMLQPARGDHQREPLVRDGLQPANSGDRARREGVRQLARPTPRDRSPNHQPVRGLGPAPRCPAMRGILPSWAPACWWFARRSPRVTQAMRTPTSSRDESGDGLRVPDSMRRVGFRVVEAIRDPQSDRTHSLSSGSEFVSPVELTASHAYAAGPLQRSALRHRRDLASRRML